METEKAIKGKYLKLHDDLTKAFYTKKRSKAGVTPQEQAAFDTTHAQIWIDQEAELRTGGYLPPPPPDYKALYAQAPTDKEKLVVIARSLGLE